MFHTHRHFLCHCFQHTQKIYTLVKAKILTFLSQRLCVEILQTTRKHCFWQRRREGEPRWRFWLQQRKPFESQQSGFWGRSTALPVANDWPDSCSQERGHGHQTHTNWLNRPFSLGVLCHWCKIHCMWMKLMVLC